jgi:hemerythrin-like domain-containing protein
MNQPHHCGCGGNHPVDVLHAEHAVILRVLDGLAHEAASLRRGGGLRPDYWLHALDFLEHFADRCHHGKEEELLFVELERAGMGHDHGPLACMRHEHEQGRAARQQMIAALRQRDGNGLAHLAAAYVEQLRQHVEKEDLVLFPLAFEMLDEAAVARLRDGFAAHEQSLGDGTHARYERLAGQLRPPADVAAMP